MWQKELDLYDISEDADDKFYAGGGQYNSPDKGHSEHFPQLWCNPGFYSVYGQVRRCTVLHLDAVLYCTALPASTLSWLHS